VREALRKLQAQHLVVLVPNKGATVRFPSRSELRDVYVVRAELEGFACELACPAVDDAVLEALDSAQADIDEGQAVLERGALRPDEEPAFNARVTSANQTFHTVIFDAAGNEQLAQLCRSLQGYFPKDYVWRAALPASEARMLNVEEHREIREALATADGKRARSAMSRHITHGGNALIDHLEQHGFWE
jgi:DNA-binding GntR family transcriptional regulator